MAKGLSVFTFNDYRLFVKEKFEEMRLHEPGLSFRKFAKMAGFGSPNYISMVIDGSRNLTEMTIERFVSAFELNKDESFYFRSLVLFNQATTSDDKQIYAQQLLKSRGFKKANPLAEVQQHYFTRWYFVAIREMVGLPDFEESPSWIAERLNNQVTSAEAQQAISELLILGLIRRGPKGKLEQTQEHILTEGDAITALAGLYHEQMIKLGLESIRAYSPEVREITGVTFRIPGSRIENVRSLMQRFYNELVTILAEGENDADCVYQFNQQLFPLAPPRK